MTNADLRILLKKAETWPEEAQAELVAIAQEIELKLSDRTYEATEEELRIIDEAIASLDAGEAATEAEVESAFAKFRQ